jgi:hypothetical protein
MSMAARKIPPTSEADDELVPFNMRMSKRTLEGLDAWVDDLNRGRALGKVNRSDLIRLVLSRAVTERPDLGVK